MAKISFIEHNLTAHTIDAPVGISVMEGAVRNAVPGIDADCGGACACGTCHVHVDESWWAKAGGPNELEQSMLEFVNDVTPHSRLSCQIKVTDALDGLVVRLPDILR